MVGLLGEYRIKVMLGKCFLCEKKNERMVEKDLKKKTKHVSFRF